VKIEGDPLNTKEEEAVFTRESITKQLEEHCVDEG
jgi:hypothetical protein